jgi:hypothetical protein
MIWRTYPQIAQITQMAQITEDLWTIWSSAMDIGQ